MRSWMVLFLALLPLSSTAAPIATSDLQPGAAINSSQGAQNAGLGFAVNGPLLGTQLGAWDAGADGLATDEYVGLFDRSNQINPGDALDGLATFSDATSGLRYSVLTIPLWLSVGNFVIQSNVGSSEPYAAGTVNVSVATSLTVPDPLDTPGEASAYPDNK